MHKRNLIKLADAVEGIDPEIFDMSSYRKNKSNDYLIQRTPDCGTIGCAIGWAPLVPSLEMCKEEEALFRIAHKGTAYAEYCSRVFGVEQGSRKWKYMFDSNWCTYDNTPTGASTRIREIAYGLKDIKLPWEKYDWC